MQQLNIERGYCKETDGKRRWAKYSQGDHLLIQSETSEAKVVSIHDPKELSNVILACTTEQSQSIEEFIKIASSKGFSYFENLVLLNQKQELQFWQNDTDFEEMKRGILADHHDYIVFFNMLLNEQKQEEAMEFLSTLDTRPNEHIIMWLKGEHFIEI